MTPLEGMLGMAGNLCLALANYREPGQLKQFAHVLRSCADALEDESKCDQALGELKAFALASLKLISVREMGKP